MNNLSTRLAVAALALVLVGSTALSQASFRVPITVTNGSVVQVVELGVSPDNTFGLDNVPALGVFQEVPAPPKPPAFQLDVRFAPFTGFPSITTFKDFRDWISDTQVDSFYIELTGQTGAGADNGLATNPTTISWPTDLGLYGTQWSIRSIGAAQVPFTNMLTASDVTIPADPFTTIVRVVVTKVGATAPAPGPIFSASTSSLDFGFLAPGGNRTLSVTITNPGSGVSPTNDLSISAVAVTPANAGVSFTPAGAQTLAPNGGSVTYDVTWTPVAAGALASDLEFTTNAGTFTIGLAGNSSNQFGELYFFSGLAFNILDNDSYTESISMNYGGQPLKAIQFRIELSDLLKIQGISKGVDFPADWSLSYNMEWPSAVNVVAFGNGAATIGAGTLADFVTLSYEAVNIGDPDVQTAELRLVNILGAIEVSGDDANFNTDYTSTVTINNKTFKGDINNDGFVNILDLGLLIDHIVGRITLVGEEFDRADVFLVPAGDGELNASDVAVLQDIILTGQYDGVPIGKVTVVTVASRNLEKGAGMSDAKVTFFITEAGIVARVESTVPVKGMQADFSKIYAVPEGMKIEGVYSESGHNHLAPDVLRMVAYNADGTSVSAGVFTAAVIPVRVSDPSAVGVPELILMNENNEAIQGVEMQISLESAPELPVAFALEQNYPNPFNPTTDIRYSVPEAGAVTIAIYNMLGQQVRTLFAGEVERGTHIVRWDGKDNNGSQLSSGSYIYRMVSGKFVETKKMMLLK